MGKIEDNVEIVYNQTTGILTITIKAVGICTDCNLAFIDDGLRNDCKCPKCNGINYIFYSLEDLPINPTNAETITQ